MIDNLYQIDLFGIEKKNSKIESKYSLNVEAPIYEPKNRKPNVLELCDTYKTNKLVREILDSDIPEDEKIFLINAAQRHLVFHYEKIADYYAHSDKKTQELMEKSALVIIDFKSAIERGYIKLCDEIYEQYLGEYTQDEE